jgi:hypothetical protein
MVKLPQDNVMTTPNHIETTNCSIEIKPDWNVHVHSDTATVTVMLDSGASGLNPLYVNFHTPDTRNNRVSACFQAIYPIALTCPGRVGSILLGIRGTHAQSTMCFLVLDDGQSINTTNDIRPSPCIALQSPEIPVSPLVQAAAASDIGQNRDCDHIALQAQTLLDKQCVSSFTTSSSPDRSSAISSAGARTARCITVVTHISRGPRTRYPRRRGSGTLRSTLVAERMAHPRMTG